MSSFQIWCCYRSQNSWDGGMLPSSLFFSKQFEDIWAWGYEFWSFGFGIWSHFAWYRFQLLKNLWLSLTYLNAPNVLYRKDLDWRQANSAPGLSYYEAMLIAAVCGFALSCWNRRHLEGSICCSKAFIYLSVFIVPYKTCKLPIPYALMQPYHQMLAFELNADDTLESLPPL